MRKNSAAATKQEKIVERDKFGNIFPSTVTTWKLWVISPCNVVEANKFAVAWLLVPLLRVRTRVLQTGFFFATMIDWLVRNQ